MKLFIGENNNADWQVNLIQGDGSCFRVKHDSQEAEVNWSLLGEHNMQNAVAAIAAAAHVGVSLQQSCDALAEFSGVKRRMEELGNINGIRVYDDFAHHPTAIKTTLEGKRASLSSNNNGQQERLIAVIEARSNTMKMGYHQNTLAESLKAADKVYWYKNADTKLDLDAIASSCDSDFIVMESVDTLIESLVEESQAGDHIVIMSNGGFEGFHQRLCKTLES